MNENTQKTKASSTTTVEYRLYHVNNDASIQTIHGDCMKFVKKWTNDYVWHNEPFDLSIDVNNASCLCGCVCVGDNIIDEWFIVWLLVEYSKVESSVIISINDNDGEFLLIETAESLPDWLQPNTSTNRIFIYNGMLHIVPMPRTPAELLILPSQTPSIEQSLSIIMNSNTNTLASDEIQRQLRRRLQSFPNEALESNTHWCRCYVPLSVATILHYYPNILSNAAQTFYLRDYIDLRHGRKMHKLLSDDNTGNGAKKSWLKRMVPWRVRFTRCLYAQLKNQKFYPPKSFGLKARSNYDDSVGLAELMGVKVSCGIEMLYQQGLKDRVRYGDTNDSIMKEQQWNAYVDALTERKYFHDYIKDSKPYNDLLENARVKFESEYEGKQSTTSTTQTMTKAAQWCRRIDYLLNKEDVPDEVLKRIVEFNELEENDDDSWMIISPEELESKLYSSNNDGDDDDNNDLNELANSMKKFMESVSGLDGVDDNNSDELVSLDVDEIMKYLNNTNINNNSKNDDDGSHDNISSIEKPSVDQLRPDELHMYTLMNTMDKELHDAGLGNEFSRADEKTNNDPEMSPIDVNFNMVENLLASFQSQHGESGPVSNILSTLGVTVPHTNE